MAQYEEARLRYRCAVLASLNDGAKGEGIRQAIQAIQAARAEVARHGPPPPPIERVAEESGAWAFVRRLLLKAS